MRSRHEAGDAALAREFRLFARYLGERQVPDRLVAHYQRMHAVAARVAVSPFDHRLVAFARWSPLTTGLADAYARLARPHGLLRRKLTLCLAILESAAATHRSYDSARDAPVVTTLAALAVAGVVWLVRTTVAALVMGPVHLFSAAGPPNEPGNG